MRIGVVIPCYRQERFLPRTLAAIERALEGREWQGALALAAPPADPLPALSERWRVIPATPPGAPAAHHRLTPGAARMLGLAACGGDWVLFVDADVELDAGWMKRGLEEIARQDAGSRLAGLWGRLEEWFVDGAGERPGSPDLYRIGDAACSSDYLATLAFYRRDALLEAGGYETRLTSEEDFELGLRLTRLGFTLRSLGGLAGRHWSAPRPSFAELARRWSTGLCFGQGQVLRLYLGRAGFARLLRRQALHLATLGVWALGAIALVASLMRRDPAPIAWWAALPLLALALMSARKRSVRLALHSLLTWTLNGFGLVAGLLGAGLSPRPAAPREAAC